MHHPSKRLVSVSVTLKSNTLLCADVQAALLLQNDVRILQMYIDVEAGCALLCLLTQQDWANPGPQTLWEILQFSSTLFAMTLVVL